MADKIQKPKIRFKGYANAWEQRKLGECFAERCESMPDGELISVTINDGIKKFSELGRHDTSNDDKSKYKKVCVGDIAYNSMRMWQGASGCSPYEGIVSPAYTVLTPNSGINSKCMAYQFKLPATIHTFKINSQGITSDNWNLKFPALSEIEIYISPYEQEQAKIAAYFANLDHLITLHQQKYDTLQILKKAMLDKMFPKNGSSAPEIRFKEFTGAWEQRTFDEMASYKKGPFGSALKKEIFVPDSDDSVKVYEQQNAINKDWKLERYYITKRYANELNAFETHGGDILVSCAGTIGEIYELPLDARSGVINQALMRVRVNEQKVRKGFYKLLFNNMIEDFSKEHSNGSAMKNIPPFADLKPMITLVPSMEEQAKIDECFTNLDTLISLHQHKLDSLKNFKKAMLEKMFV